MEETTRKVICSKLSLDFSRKHYSLEKYCTKREAGNKHIHRIFYGDIIFVYLFDSLWGFIINFFHPSCMWDFKNVYFSIEKHLDEPELLYCYLS